jgi:hypothetical protein
MKKKIILLFFAFAFLERTVVDFGPNIELVTAGMVLASLYLDVKWSIRLTLAVLLLSDAVIGNSSIFVFTWTGFLIPAIFLTKIFRKFITRGGLKRAVVATSGGVGANMFFYIWTNFGVWLLDSWNMYPNTAWGLFSSYVNGLPFLRAQLISTLMFVPIGIFVFEMYFSKAKATHYLQKISVN